MDSHEVKDLERQLLEVRERSKAMHCRVVEGSEEVVKLEKELHDVTAMYK